MSEDEKIAAAFAAGVAVMASLVDRRRGVQGDLSDAAWKTVSFPSKKPGGQRIGYMRVDHLLPKGR